MLKVFLVFPDQGVQMHLERVALYVFHLLCHTHLGTIWTIVGFDFLKPIAFFSL